MEDKTWKDKKILPSGSLHNAPYRQMMHLKRIRKSDQTTCWRLILLVKQLRYRLYRQTSWVQVTALPLSACLLVHYSTSVRMTIIRKPLHKDWYSVSTPSMVAAIMIILTMSAVLQMKNWNKNGISMAKITQLATTWYHGDSRHIFKPSMS